MFAFDEIVRIASPIAEKHGIKSLALFGSYARGDATESSDLDFLFDDGDDSEMGLFEYFALVLELEKAFGLHVDLASIGSRDQDFLQSVAKEARTIYERPRLSRRFENAGTVRQN